MPEYHFVREVLRPYLRDTRNEKSLETQKVESYISNTLERFFKGYYLTFTPEHWSGRHLILNGKAVRDYRDMRKSLGFKPVSVQRELHVASAACKYCIQELDFDIPNPFEGRTVSRADRKQIRPRTRVLTEDEQEKLLTALPQPHRDMVEFMLETGLRLGEVLNLKWEQIDGNIIRFKPEQHKSRTVAASYLSARGNRIITSQVGETSFVFTRHGKRMCKSTFYKYWYRAIRGTSLSGIRPHDLRRTLGGRFRQSHGLDVAQAQLRHTDRRTTERVYARPTVDVILDAMSRTKNVIQDNELA